MIWIVFAGYLAIFIFLLKKLAARFNIRTKWLVIVFLLKVSCGLAYGYLDLHTKYGGDSLNYFNDGCWMHEPIHERPGEYFRMLTGINDTSLFIQERYVYYMTTWKVNDFDYFFNDSRTIVRIHAFIRLFSFGSYGVHVIVFAFLSVIGLLLIYRVFRPYIRVQENLLFYVLFMIPSSLIWFSSLLKEPLVIFGSALLFSASVRMAKEGFSGRQLLVWLSAALLLAATRFFVLLCWLPALLVLAWLYRKPAQALLKIILIMGCIVVAAASFDYFATDYRFSQVLHDQMMNSVKNKEYFNPGTKVRFEHYAPEFGSVLAHSPMAFLHTAMAPVYRLNNPYRFLFFMENVILLLFAGWILAKAKKPEPGAMPLLACTLVFLLFMYVLIGLTTPFEGTMIRLRSIVLPFLLPCLLLFATGETPGAIRRFTQFFRL